MVDGGRLMVDGEDLCFERLGSDDFEIKRREIGKGREGLVRHSASLHSRNSPETWSPLTDHHMLGIGYEDQLRRTLHPL